MNLISGVSKMTRKPNIVQYIDKQFSELCNGVDNGEYTFPVFTKMKLQNENGQTNYLNVTNDQMIKIMQVLKERNQ